MAGNIMAALYLKSRWNLESEITNEDDIIFVELNKDNLMKYRNDFPLQEIGIIMN